ncbi:peptide deformylase [Brachybacterium sp. GCM10030267]|uniref:peptide deformylase n=1 Tax=Brachybacterium sp. GCM10030267 TaxID=3273381 RepID=UPI0036232689
MDITELSRKILERRPSEEDPLRIVQSGHPALRRRAVAAGDRIPAGLLLELAEAMTITMRRAPGVGLAAPQIGLPLALVVVEDRYAGAGAGTDADVDAGADAEDAAPGEASAGEDPLERRPFPLRALLDPQVELLGTQRVYAWEGCLSVDGWQSIVPRARRVRLRATELLPGGDLREIDEEHGGWPARILQHETDHLAGILCHDKMVPRSFISARYTAHYTDMPDAVRRLGLSGEITQLGEGEVIADRA